MAQNVEHWLLDRTNFEWARTRIPQDKWYQIRKYFPGEQLRKDMVYYDADTGEMVNSSQFAYVPPGRVFIYGYDLHNFVGIDIAGMGEGTGPQLHRTLSKAPTPGAPPPEESPEP